MLSLDDGLTGTTCVLTMDVEVKPARAVTRKSAPGPPVSSRSSIEQTRAVLALALQHPRKGPERLAGVAVAAGLQVTISSCGWTLHAAGIRNPAECVRHSAVAAALDIAA